MPVTVNWYDDEQTIIRYEIIGLWKWPEFQDAWHQANGMVAGVDHPVDFIVDLTASVLVPAEATRRFRQLVAAHPRHARAGNVVIVGADKYIVMLWHIMSSFIAFPFDAHFEADLEAAQQYIQDQRTP
jgi:hypothetical protein